MSSHRVDSSMPAGSVTVYDLEGTRIGDVNRNVLGILPGIAPSLQVKQRLLRRQSEDRLETIIRGTSYRKRSGYCH
jgi:hypothetical protein